jgi:hypothetical protein
MPVLPKPPTAIIKNIKLICIFKNFDLSLIMNIKKIIRHHRLFFVYLVLFLIVAVIDLLNLDRVLYSAVCFITTYNTI